MAAIVHNSGVNYTLYYNVLNYFKTIMNNHPSIEVVTQGLIQDFDTREFPQYPVGNVSILSSNFVGTTTQWEIQLILADKIKNRNNESGGAFNTQTIPFYGVDDTVDIHANTLAIINDLTSYTANGVDGFEIISDILCEPFEDRFNNGLAGWVCTFTLTVHNDRNRCIFFLISPDGNGYKIQDCLTSEYKYAVISGSVNVGDYFSSQIGTTTNCFYVDSEVTNFNSWDYVNLKPLDFYGSCIECQTGILPTTSTTTISPTTSTTTLVPTTSTTTLVPTTSTTTLVPTTSTTTQATLLTQIYGPTIEGYIESSSLNKFWYDDLTYGGINFMGNWTTYPYWPLNCTINGLEVTGSVVTPDSRRIPISNNFSLQFYGSINNTGGNMAVWAIPTTPENSDFWWIDTSNSMMYYARLASQTNPGYPRYTSGSITLDNNPHMYSLLFDGGNNSIKLYEDLNLIGSGSVTGSAYASTSVATMSAKNWFGKFGNSTLGTIPYFSGSIIGVNAWNGQIEDTLSETLTDFQNITWSCPPPTTTTTTIP